MGLAQLLTIKEEDRIFFLRWIDCVNLPGDPDSEVLWTNCAVPSDSSYEVPGAHEERYRDLLQDERLKEFKVQKECDQVQDILRMGSAPALAPRRLGGPLR